MDFLGFLEEKRIFLEFLIKRKLSLYCRPHGIPGSQLRPGLPVAAVRLGPLLASRSRSGGSRCGGLRCGLLCGRCSEWRAAPDPGDHSAATCACGRSCAWVLGVIPPPPPRVRGVLDEMPETAAARRRLAGGKVRSAGPTYDRSEGEV
jgi:hypothetical protein